MIFKGFIALYFTRFLKLYYNNAQVYFMTLPTTEPIVPEDEKLPPARKRRQQRTLAPGATSAERAEFLQEVAHRVTPSVDFYLFSLLAATVLLFAILLDSPALYILVVLLAPFMAPVVGMSLAVSMGSLRFFLRSLLVTIIGGVIFFLSGLAAGIIAHRFSITQLDQISDHNVFSWPDLLVLTVGAVLTALLLVRSRQRPLVASVALVYELFVPLSMAGFGLTSGIGGLFPDGLLVFGIHLTWAVLIGAITLALLGFRPRKVFGFILALLLVLGGLLSLVFITGFGASFLLPKAQTTAAPEIINTPALNTPAALPTDTLEPAATPTLAAVVNATSSISAATSTRTLVPSPTPTETLTPQPTPTWATVYAADGDGANVRAQAGFDQRVVATVSNGGLVQVLSAPQAVNNTFWVLVRTESGIEGWMVQFLLVTATPAPNW